jgi:hypothetical protein
MAFESRLHNTCRSRVGSPIQTSGNPSIKSRLRESLFGGGLRAEHCDGTASHSLRRELDRIESHRTGFEPLVVEYVVHKRQQVISRVLHGINQRPAVRRSCAHDPATASRPPERSSACGSRG